MYALPVRATEAFEIVDANGVVLVPCILYKGDIAHRTQQLHVLHELALALNNRNGYYLIQVGETHKFERGEPREELVPERREDPAEIVQVINSRRGNPAFQKGKPNPYAKKGGVNA